MFFTAIFSISVIGGCERSDPNDNSISRNEQGFYDKRTTKNLFRSAESGDPQAQVDLARAFAIGDISGGPNAKQAIYWAEKAADQDYVYAFLFLQQAYEGDLYFSFEPLTDPLLAIGYKRKAAEHGDAFSAYDLAKNYLNGSVVEKDHQEALKWLKVSAKNKHALAQIDLATLYESGTGVERSRSAAKELYRSAYRSEEYSVYKSLAGHNLARVHLDEGLLRPAAQIYFELANNGNAKAQIELGRFYENGFVVPKNDRLAYMWTSLGAFSQVSNSDATKRLATLEAKLSDDLIASAQDYAEICLNSKYENCRYPDWYSDD